MSALNRQSVKPQINEHNIGENENISNDELDMEFTESELHSALFSQNNNKSPGIDSITSEILKASYDFISPFLLYLYNRIFNTGQYPRAWGEGIIAPIFKKGDVNDASNYRGITLIKCRSKSIFPIVIKQIDKMGRKI